MVTNSSTQIKIMTFTPCATGFLSLLCSTALVYNILNNRKKKLTDAYHRIMLGMSVMDIIQSLTCLASSFPAPKGIPGMYTYGNTATCDAQGFFAQISVSGPLFNCILSIHYLLSISFGMKEREFRKRVEGWLYFVALGFPMGTAIAGQILQVYNFAGNRCWIADYPLGCAEIEGMECTRGGNSVLIRWIFSGIPVIICFIILFINMVVIFSSVRKQERRLRLKYNHVVRRRSSFGYGTAAEHDTVMEMIRAEEKRDYKLSNRLAKQGCAYVAAFSFTYSWSFALRITEMITGKIWFPLVFCVSCFNPLQGFFNFFIYIQPHVNRLRRRNPNKSFLWALSHSVFTGDTIDFNFTDKVVTQMSLAVRRFSFRRSSFFKHGSHQNGLEHENDHDSETRDFDRDRDRDRDRDCILNLTTEQFQEILALDLDLEDEDDLLNDENDYQNNKTLVSIEQKDTKLDYDGGVNIQPPDPETTLTLHIDDDEQPTEQELLDATTTTDDHHFAANTSSQQKYNSAPIKHVTVVEPIFTKKCLNHHEPAVSRKINISSLDVTSEDQPIEEPAKIKTRTMLLDATSTTDDHHFAANTSSQQKYNSVPIKHVTVVEPIFTKKCLNHHEPAVSRKINISSLDVTSEDQPIEEPAKIKTRTMLLDDTTTTDDHHFAANTSSQQKYNSVPIKHVTVVEPTFTKKCLNHHEPAVSRKINISSLDVISEDKQGGYGLNIAKG